MRTTQTARNSASGVRAPLPSDGAMAKAVRHLESGEWEAAHLLVQKDASEHACWAHGIVHLIEGDLENAKYWYRRAHRPLPHGNTVAAEIAALKAAVREGAATPARRSRG
jgi:hypothetical protein